MPNHCEVFKRLGLPPEPVILAPLAGVSDHPFRRIASRLGADLSYVEMISARAFICNSERTLAMMERHPDEAILGLQVTGSTADDVAQAIAGMAKLPYETIDINMGCPVRKVVNSGSGSAILKDPQRVYDTLKASRAETDKAISCKIRIGWDHESINALEIAQAAEEAGAAWITVHGRTRSDDYSAPVDLEMIARVKAQVQIPVIANGNIFSLRDGLWAKKLSGADGLMVSRGALGNPWVFRELKGGRAQPTLQEWKEIVLAHLDWQSGAYGDSGPGALCMRKHLLWYLSGWPGARKIREQVNQSLSLEDARVLILRYCDQLEQAGAETRFDQEISSELAQRFKWDPKYDMDRNCDRGVGTDGLELA